MGWLDDMDEERSGPDLFSTLRDPAPWLLDAMGAAPTTSGEPVSEEKALCLSVVYGCVRLIAETASLPPLRLYRRETTIDEEGRKTTRRHRVDSPEARVIRQPNRFMTEASFRETLTAHLALWRNAYAEIERDGNGDPINLWPVPPWRAQVEVVDGQKVVVVDVTARAGSQERRTLWPGDYLHLHALSLDGLKGRPLLSGGWDGGDARNSVGLSLAIEKDAALYYRHGMKMQGYWVTEGSLEDGPREKLEQELRSLTQGLDNFHRTALLEEGVEWKEMGGGAPVVEQLLAMRVFQVQDIARFFGITQLHKLGDLSRATFSNIGEQREEFYTDTMMVYFLRWEQFVGLQLLSPEQQRDHYFKFNTRALLRGSFADELESLRGSVVDGLLTLDEARELIDRDPYPNGIGALPRFQLNTASAEPTGQGSALPAAPSSKQSPAPSPKQLARQVIQALRPSLQRSAEHFTRREARAAQRAWTRSRHDPAAFGTAMERTWRELPEAIRRELQPTVAGAVAAVEALGGGSDNLRAVAEAHLNEVVSRYIEHSRRELAEGLARTSQDGESRPGQWLEATLNHWQTRRADELAGEEIDHLAARLVDAAFDDEENDHD